MPSFNWWTFIPNCFCFFIIPGTAFYFFCLYCNPYPKDLPPVRRLSRRQLRFILSGFLYILFSALLFFAEISFNLTGFLCLLPEIVLLFLCGWLFRPFSLRSFSEWLSPLTASTLVISVSGLCHGISYLLFFWFLAVISPAPDRFPVVCLDSAEAFVRELLSVAILLLIRKYFRRGTTGSDRLAFLSLTIPVFYIALVERTIQDSIYGDTIVWDSEQGILSPVVNHMEILILQLFACACLLLTLVAWQKIQKALRHEQTIQVLKQQTQAQETYMREIRLCYEQTRSFRHDIKNHLTVLAELLNAGRTDRACEYLSHLEQISGRLSVPVQTGNAAADALLNAKFSLARQQNISVHCAIKIPEASKVSDIDWCILLANAADNAIKALGALPPQNRTLSLSGKQQGNFYLVTMENDCSPDMTASPRDGIGLSNIRAVMDQYGGTVKIEADGKTFRLHLFFVFT